MWFSTGIELLLDSCKSQVPVHWSVKMSAYADWQLLLLKTSPRGPSSSVSLETSKRLSCNSLPFSAELPTPCAMYAWSWSCCNSTGDNGTMSWFWEEPEDAKSKESIGVDTDDWLCTFCLSSNFLQSRVYIFSPWKKTLYSILSLLTVIFYWSCTVAKNSQIQLSSKYLTT